MRSLSCGCGMGGRQARNFRAMFESTREVCRNAWRPDRRFWSVSSDDCWATRAGKNPEDSRQGFRNMRAKGERRKKKWRDSRHHIMTKLIFRQIPLRTLGLEPETYKCHNIAESKTYHQPGHVPSAVLNRTERNIYHLFYQSPTSA